MKIHRLSITGFGPFLDTQEVDFDAFEAEGLFLIAGKTGAGKSSILDAICFALYDGAPRYDGAPGKLRSDHCGPGDPTVVELEFSTGGERYRVLRSPGYDRPKARGTGTTRQKPTAELWIQRPDGWEALSALPREVGQMLSDIVRLKREQFLQVILLAQNRFGEFLRAQSEDRLKLLRTLFGTARFERYETDLFERMRAAEGTISVRKQAADALAERMRDARPSPEAVSEPVDGEATPGYFAGQDMPAVPDPEWYAGARGASAESLRRVTAAFERVETEARTARERLREREGVRERQERLTRAREEHATLLADSDAIAGLTTEAAAAERALRVSPALAARRAAAAVQATAERVHGEYVEQAQAEALAGSMTSLNDSDQNDSKLNEMLLGDAAAGAEALAALADLRTRALGRLEEEERAARELPRLRGALDTATVASTSAEGARDAAVLRAECVPADLALARDARGRAALIAQNAPALRAATEALRVRRAALTELEDLAPRIDAAHELAREAADAQAAAAAHQREILRRRLAGFAGELAGDLEPGEPCPVCGSTTHPAPAVAEPDAVGEGDVQAAEEAVTRAAQTLSGATSRLAEVESTRAALRERVAGDAVPVVETHELADLAGTASVRERLDAASRERAAEREAAEAARAELPELDEAIAALEEEQRLADQRIRDARDALASAESAATEARTALTALSERVATAHAGFDSLGEAIESATHARDLAQNRARSTADLSRARESVAAALEAETAALIEHGFSSAAAAEEAVRPDLERLRERIRRHDTALAAVAGRLSEPDLADLPDTLVDPEAEREAARVADSARDTAAELRHDERSRHQTLETLLDQLAGSQADIAAELAAFERLRALTVVVRGGENNARRMRLESFVLAAELEEIVRAANLRLQEMSGGRFRLEHDDAVQHGKTQSGLGLAIFDAFTGATRSPLSLSGGESFLASLALALGLSEVVTQRAGGITLDTLFIDEGFGSLDAETLDVAMATLDGLRAGGRTVGVISHVPAMQEMIPSRLTVTATAAGPSRITH
ncbi:SMC family ATPase [Mycetocola tolaasinivorans]|uniref:Nuclease SbcCD subunit C n=1 Tax=Mycetocola tolaasinivorans TaxID=76635 RepID=A0A3L7ACE2_9MICO|nr:AAA family ATPase [Mycetocola tolaasinivorans]RLP78023.1 SMC family ATPase [Mycetocola tolaasinivorans]